MMNAMNEIRNTKYCDILILINIFLTIYTVFKKKKKKIQLMIYSSKTNVQKNLHLYNSRYFY